MLLRVYGYGIYIYALIFALNVVLTCLQNSPEMFFRDGKRRIDYVLVFSGADTDETAKAKRYAFLSALAEQMIEIEVILYCFIFLRFIISPFCNSLFIVHSFILLFATKPLECVMGYCRAFTLVLFMRYLI